MRRPSSRSAGPRRRVVAPPTKTDRAGEDRDPSGGGTAASAGGVVGGRTGHAAADPGLGEHELARAAASWSPANAAATERTCSYPVIARNDGARP